MACASLIEDLQPSAGASAGYARAKRPTVLLLPQRIRGCGPLRCLSSRVTPTGRAKENRVFASPSLRGTAEAGARFPQARRAVQNGFSMDGTKALDRAGDGS